MPTNEFLPFAIDPAANVITQGAWGALPARTGGFVAGLAQSNQLNKAWRQATVMAAAIGQLINDYGALDALDDGNVANLVRDLARSMQGNKFGYVVATGTANAWVLAPTPSVASYAAGRLLWVKAPATNTGTSVTAAISGLVAKPIKKSDGSNPEIGDLVSGRWYATIDDGTNICVVNTLSSDVANVNLPIFPEILTGGAVLSFTASVGQVVVDSGASFMWRGLRKINTAAFAAPERTFATAANKTYHLRWDAPGTGAATPAATYPNGRFDLVDLTTANPPETDAVYDRTYDRILGAKVVTNGANVPTVIALQHKARLVATAVKSAVTRHSTWTGAPGLSATINWGVTPTPTIVQMNCDAETDLEAFNWCTLSASRYSVSGFVGGYMLNTASWSPNTFISGGMTVRMEA